MIQVSKLSLSSCYDNEWCYNVLTFCDAVLLWFVMRSSSELRYAVSSVVCTCVVHKRCHRDIVTICPGLKQSSSDDFVAVCYYSHLELYKHIVIFILKFHKHLLLHMSVTCCGNCLTLLDQTDGRWCDKHRLARLDAGLYSQNVHDTDHVGQLWMTWHHAWKEQYIERIERQKCEPWGVHVWWILYAYTNQVMSVLLFMVFV